MAQQLAGKTALITGAASGIGRAVAELFLREGANVVAFDRSEFLLDRGERKACASIVGDVRSAADNQRAVELAVSRFGGLDVLVANAGVYDNRRAFRSFTAAELEAGFDELFGVNVKGYLLAALAAAEALARARGCILFTSSISGERAGFGGALYVAAKHAINGLTKQLALELAPHVRVNAVAPAYVPTGLSGLQSLGQAGGTAGPAASQMPLEAFMTADDVAAAYLFLASDACTRTATGTVLSLDAGAALRGPRP